MTDPNQQQPARDDVAISRTTVTVAPRRRSSDVEAQRMKRVIAWRGPFAVVLIIFGLLPFLGELGRYYFENHPIHATPIFVGAVLAFVGFYMLEPGGALSGGMFLVNSTVALVSVIRSGRRATDTPVVAVPPATPAAPDAPPTDHGIGG